MDETPIDWHQDRQESGRRRLPLPRRPDNQTLGNDNHRSRTTRRNFINVIPS